MEITTDAEAAAHLRIDGPVGQFDYSADSYKDSRRLLKEEVAKELAALAALKVAAITVDINSLGGSFAHALAIHDYLAQFPGQVTTRVVGMTASAATIIAQAGKVREISANALYLIHRCGNPTEGNAVAHRRAADTFETFDRTMAAIYAKRGGAKEADIWATMNQADGQGAWMTAPQALALGLADVIFEPTDAAAVAAWTPSAAVIATACLPPVPDAVANVPSEQTEQAVANTPNVPKPEAGAPAPMKLTTEQIKSLQARFGAEHAVAAAVGDLDYPTAVDQGVETLAKAMADVRAQLAANATAQTASLAEIATLKKQILDAKAGLDDPLAANAAKNPPPGADAKAKADADATAAQDAKELAELVASANSAR
jgi:ATP-dependent protease ClpP protease subunit